MALFAVAKAILGDFRAAQGQARPARFRRSDRARAGAAHSLDAAWVLYKLDYGLDHMLRRRGAGHLGARNGESSAALSAEFFAGAGARRVNAPFSPSATRSSRSSRSRARRRRCSPRCDAPSSERHRDAERPFADVPLTLSFRSAQTILDAVDKIFGVRCGLARRRRRRRAAAAARGVSPRLAGPGRDLAADRARPERRDPRTGACRSIMHRRTTRRSNLAQRIAAGHQPLAVAGLARAGGRPEDRRERGAFAQAT